MRRSTTYDATAGEIVMEGKSITGPTFTLPPRGLVWVISNEEFHLPGDTTGLATLRTTWTHQGILALNLGVIDPGWNDRVATAVVNFSKNDFEIRKGDTFFRVLFLCHHTVPVSQIDGVRGNYLDGIKERARHFSGTFLTMDSLIVEVADKVLGLPRWAVKFAYVAILISLFAIILPIAWTVISQNYVMPGRVDALEKAVAALQSNCRVGH